MTDVSNKNWPARVAYSILAILIACVVIALCNKDKITNYFQPEAETVTVTDSTIIDVPPTIDEVVSLRRDILDNMRIDSVYLTMSDIELTAILMKIGTNSTIKEIVDAYIRLKPQLKDVLLGADIAEKLIKEQQLKMQPLDTVPTVPLPVITPPSKK